MSNPFTTERRHSQRVALTSDHECRLDLRTRVRMLDLSLSGTFLAAELGLPAGASARLRSSLGPNAFRREGQNRRRTGLGVGLPMNGVAAMFTTMDERSRRILEDFLRKASQ